MIDVSVIIVCYKGWAKLIKCLDSLNSFTGKRFDYEVIVVNNGPESSELEELKSKFIRFKFVQNPVNGGFGNGNNLGAGMATGKFLLFLNPDTVASESAVESLLKTATENPSYSIISCRQVNDRGKESIATGQFPGLLNLTGFQRAIFRRSKSVGVNYGESQKAEVTFPDWISGSVILISKKLFHEINGFDDDFWMYFEDVDICKRVNARKGLVAFCRNIVIEHNHGGSSRINLKTASLTKTEVFISKHLYISKHKRGFEKLVIQSFLVLNNFISAGITAVFGLFLFFIPKVFTRTLIFFLLISYYTNALLRWSWISSRSVNYDKN